MRDGTDSGHGYARLTPSHAVEVLAPPQEGGLLFVDVAVSATDTFEQMRDAWRSIPPSVIGMCSEIVLRSPVVRFAGELQDVSPADKRRLLACPEGWPTTLDDFAEQVSEMLRENGHHARQVHAFELPVAGQVAMSSGLTAGSLATCRAVELEALLRSTNAIWRPTTYHYRLPSGQHAGLFIRVADVFNDRRAAPALASWLRGATKDSTMVVIDTGTLVPLVDQLSMWLERASLRLTVSPGVVSVVPLNSYPRSRHEYLSRFANASDILAVLSVSSSGRTYDLLSQSLSETVGDHGWRAECLVSRVEEDRTTDLPLAEATGRQAAWLTVPSQAAYSADDCQLCHEPRRARVVRIDPRTFSAMVLPEPVREMPDIASAARNASLFDRYVGEFAQAPVILLAPGEQARVRAQPLLRGDQRERVRFEPLALLSRDDVADVIGNRLAELQRLPAYDLARKTILAAHANLLRVEPTIAVCDREEVKTLTVALTLESGGALDGERAQAKAELQMLEAARAACGSVERIIAVGAGSQDGERKLCEKLAGADRLMLLVAGLQTGVTLQHLVARIGEAAPAGSKICGLVLHAHPQDSSTWRSARNMFGGQRNPSLLALWLTYLSAQSPFVEEHRLLSVAREEWFEGARFGASERWRERVDWTSFSAARAHKRPEVRSPLWSASEGMSLRDGSRYGKLDARRVVAAMGSALSASLDRHRRAGSPEWAQVDLPNAFRSYFDALLPASLLRWVSPARAWWGTSNECQSLLDELAGRFRDSRDELYLLLAELLLGAALGKLPDEGVRVVLEHAQRLMDDPEPQGETDVAEQAHPLGFIELGTILVRNLLPRTASTDTAPA